MAIIRKKDGDEWILEREEGSLGQTPVDDESESPEDETYVWRALNLDRSEYASKEDILRFIQEGRQMP
ncbi:hypothetical protein [Leucobacter sp. M11]|uniref:hypothetical protein n=1 Tax=Leucobacter sp. M11 TaxID=2993565 RepID=UPI002D7FC6DE|nr:hypothetical protein [Leucobacter sp. M11]MEB4614024.1 hypothetical protein [Leucobacter sp. M11]